MTISTTENKVSYEGDGTLTEFTFLFKVLSVGHIKVYLDDALQGSGYTVNLNPDQTTDPGGSVEFDTAPADGVTVTLLRSVPIDQLVDYTPYDPFPADTHEGALDKLTMIAQQQQEELDRTIQFPPSASLPDRDAGEGLFPAYDAGKGLMWSETDENVLVNSNDNLNGIIEDCEDARDEAIAAKDRAILAENNAKASEVAAKASEDAAAISEGNAAVSASDAATRQGYAYQWAQEEEDIPVDDGVHQGYSAYHWALKSSEGGLVQLDTTTPETLNTYIVGRTGYIDTITNQPNALCKLNASGKVPYDLLGFSGLNLIGTFRGDNDCPKIGNDPDCTEPDYRNPSERFPNVTWSAGDYFITTTAGDVNLRNRDELDQDTWSPQPVAIGDGIIYLPDTEYEGTTYYGGWFLVVDVVKRNVIASDVLFDDTTTNTKGVNVQAFNSNLDAEVYDHRVFKDSDITYAHLPKGSTGDQGDSGLWEAGLIRFNTETNKLEYSDNTPEFIEVATAGDLADADASLQSHIADTANPHAVTAAQVGALPITGGTLTGALTAAGVTSSSGLTLSGGNAALGAGTITTTGTAATGALTVTGAITATGNITAFSDIRLKEDIKPIDNALDKVSKIEGVTFKHKESGDLGTGLIAQELQAVLPEAVVENEDGILSISYGNVVGLLVEAIKELKTEINVLKGEA